MVDNSVLKEEEINALLKRDSSEEILERESAISWDGRNLIVRIPREVADYLNIDEKNRFKKNFKFVIEGDTQKFEITERNKPMRENKNANNNKKTKKNN